MKKFRIFLLVMTGAAVLMLGGCKEKAKYDESAFQDDLEPLTDDELEDMDENSDDEMIVEDDAELEQSQQQEDSTEKADAESTDSNEETQRRWSRRRILQRKTAQKVQITLQKTKWMKKERIRTKMMLPSIFMSMGMRRQTFLQKVTIMQIKCFR